MATKEFTNAYPNLYNTNSGVSPTMEPVVDDDDDALASQLNSIVAAQIEVEKQVGDDTEAAGTLRYRISAAEAASGTGDGKVKITAADTTKNYLGDKIFVGTGLTMTSGDPGGNEILTISATGGGGDDEKAKVSATDTTAGYLSQKILAGTGVTLTSGSPGGDETLTISTLAFVDALDDDSIHSNWTIDIPTVGTVVEQNGRLEVAHTGGTSLDWYHSVNFNAPGVYTTVEPYDFSAKVFVDNITSTNDQHAAMILYLDGTPASHHRLEVYYNSVYKVRVINGASVGGATTVSQDNLWLCIIRRGFRIYFLYSTAAKTAEPALNDMTILASHTTGIDPSFGILNNLLSLRCLTSAGTPAFTNYWNNFSIRYP